MQQKFISNYLACNDARLAVERTGYKRGRKDVWDLMHNPRILQEIERRRRTPKVEDFIKPGEELAEGFVLAQALELLEAVKRRGDAPEQVDRAARLLELIAREQAKIKPAEEEKPNPYAKLTAEEVAQRLADNMAKLEAIEAELAVSPTAEAEQDPVHNEMVKRVAELKLALAQPAQVVPLPSDEKDPHAPWRQASPPAWRPPKPTSEPNLGARKMCLNNADHGTYTGRICPACQEFWRAEAAREARSWNRALVPPLWG